MKSKLLCIAHIEARMKAVASFFQHVSRLLDQPFVIVACKAVRGNAESKLFLLSRLQFRCFLKTDQNSLCFPEFTLWRLTVQLYKLSSGYAARIGYNTVERQPAVFRKHGKFREGKFCICKAKTKRITDLFRSARYRFKIPVADVDVFRVFHIILGIMKMFRTWINIKAAGKSIRQMTGRSFIPAEDIRGGKPALHAALPGKQSCFHLCSFFKPGCIKHSPDIQHNDDFVKRRQDRICHSCFFPAEIEIPVKRLA